ncbi:MAG TPA: hypothetical protein PLD68_06870 [Clostridiales bacterium]|nr:hypothetical protein [Clostridiales bacterium]HQH63120.1 hypothetical protein [Clostridiales bacterium]
MSRFTLPRLWRLAVCAAIVMTVFCSCTRDGGSSEQTLSSTHERSTAAETSGVTVETGTQPSQSTPAATATTVQESSNAATTSAPATTAVSPENTTPATVEEIVACFNEAANKIKQEKPGYRFSVESATDRDSMAIDAEIPFKGFITRFIASGINKETKSTVSRGNSHNDFPVKGQSVASKLKADAIKSASCMLTGDYYVIELHFKDEKLNTLPEKPFGCRHGNAFSVILASDFANAFGGIHINMPGFKVQVENKKFAPTYTGSIITCSIRVSGMRMTQAKYFLNSLCVVETEIDVNRKIYPMVITFNYSVTESYVFT